MRNFESFEKKLGLSFKEKDLLKKAFVHRSYINEHSSYKLGHNERLEFLGDAVLELIVTEWLFKKYPDAEEGDMTNWRASLVNAQIISVIAQEMGMEPLLYLSRGESKDRLSKARQMILADALEALIGAIYIDQGLEACIHVIKDWLLVKFDDILANRLYLDPKSSFQEQSQERLGITPSYKVLSAKGPDHNKMFIIGVYLKEKKASEGQGGSKQEAQLAAAQSALDNIKWSEWKCLK